MVPRSPIRGNAQFKQRVTVIHAISEPIMSIWTAGRTGSLLPCRLRQGKGHGLKGIFMCASPLLLGMDLTACKLSPSTCSTTEVPAQRGGSFLTSSRRIIPGLCNHEGTREKEVPSVMGKAWPVTQNSPLITQVAATTPNIYRQR